MITTTAKTVRGERAELEYDVKRCSSCGQEHAHLHVTEFVSPPMIGDTEYPLVAQCPETWEAIYIREKA